MANAAQITKLPISMTTDGVCDLSKRTYFHIVMYGNTPFSFINTPEDTTIFELQVSLVGGVLSWPENVRWVGGLAPQNLNTNKIRLFYFRRPQGAGVDQWLGAYLPNF